MNSDGDKLTALPCLIYHASMSYSNRIAALIVTLAFTQGPVSACAVPVFRYALERWKPSAYQVQITHGRALTDAELALIDRMKQSSANLNVKTTNAAGEPRLTLRYPDGEEVVCSGLLTEGFVNSILDSPVRQRLVKHVCNGESGVWILLESGDKVADDTVANMLGSELARLSGEIKLPEQDPRDLLSVKAPLKVSFVTLRVSRSDLAETRLVEMLLGGEEGLDKVTGPIVFPVFGRGRVRVGLHGARLRPVEVERWASSLCGPCSCVIKEQNPGYDLLLAADWETLLELDPVPVENPMVAPEIPPGAPPRDVQEESGVTWVFVAGAGLLVVLTATMALRDRRSVEPQ